MMAVVIPKEAWVNMADEVHAQYTDYSVHLYQNDFTPDENTVLTDLTVATYSGYSSKADQVTLHELNVGRNQGQAQWPKQDFAHDGGGTSNTVYGWFIKRVNKGSGGGYILAAVKRLDTPKVMDDATDHVVIQPSLFFGPCFGA